MFRSSMNRFFCLSLALLALGFVGSAGAGEQYFLLMYASQRVPANPNYSHTFATFAKVSWQGDGPCPRIPLLESHTISWLPANMIVRTGALKPECGHNFGLHVTLREAYRTNQRVSLWGPYPVQPELYYRALNRQAELEGGKILYKANDVGYRSDRVTNCIHAVSTIVEGPKLRIASPGWGQSASYFVLKEMKPSILSYETEPWIGSALGLDQYPILYRDYRNPRSNTIVGPVFRLLGNERGMKATYGPPTSVLP